MRTEAPAEDGPHSGPYRTAQADIPFLTLNKIRVIRGSHFLRRARGPGRNSALPRADVRDEGIPQPAHGPIGEEPPCALKSHWDLSMVEADSVDPGSLVSRGPPSSQEH